MFDASILEEAIEIVLDRRLDKALKNTRVSRFTASDIKDFLRKIGDKFSRGDSVFVTVPELCPIADRSEKTVRIWLSKLSRAGIITKRRAGPNGLEIQLHPDFVYTEAHTNKPVKNLRLELAIEQRMAEIGDNARKPEVLRYYLRKNMREEEIEAAISRREAAYRGAAKKQA